MKTDDMPEEFRTVASYFHQDSFRHGELHAELIADSIAGLDPRGLEVLRAYLDKLLSGAYGADELRRLWMKTPADVCFFSRKRRGDDEAPIVRHLRLMREAVGRRSTMKPAPIARATRHKK